MSDVSGIPNMGFGGGSYYGTLGGNAATGTPAMSSAQIMASLYGNYSPGAAQSTLSNIYGAGGFGAQPAYYAALGAAYGRQVAPSSSAAVAASNAARWPTPAARAPVADPYAFLRGAPSSGQVGPYGSAFNYSPYSMTQAAPAPAVNPYAQMYRMPTANPSYFNPATYAGAGGNYGIPYNGQSMAGDIGFSRQPSYPNLGYNSSFSSLYAQPAYNNNFAARFGQWGANAGSPSQYYSPAQQPPSFSQPYSIDQPGGALPLQPGIYANSPFGN